MMFRLKPKFEKIVVVVLFSAITVLYLLHINPGLIYFAQQVVPFKISLYASSPGGISVYLANFIIQFLNSGISGIPVLFALFVIMWILLSVLLKKYRKSSLWLPLSFLSLLPILMAQAKYTFPFKFIIELNIVFLILIIFNQFIVKNKFADYILFLIKIIAIYYLTSASGLILSLLLILAISLLKDKDPFKFVLQFVTALIVPLFFVFSVNITYKQAYLGSFITGHYRSIPVFFYLQIVAPAFVMIILSVLDKKITFRSDSKKTNSTWILSSSIVLIIVIISLILTIQPDKKNRFMILMSASEENWDSVLELANKDLCRSDRIIQFQVNRALLHKGKLLEEMFNYPQYFAENALLIEKQVSGEIALFASEIYYDLGFLNAARHWANEAYIVLGNHPIVLKKLIKCYLFLGRFEAAHKYLKILESSCLYKDWCSKYVEYFSDNSKIQSDKEYIFFQTNNPQTDFFTSSSKPLYNLEFFYRLNPDNKLVFEYYLASCLVKHDVGKIVKLIPEFKRFGYQELPRTIQEAILVYWAKTGLQSPPTNGYKIDNEVLNSFKEYSSTMTQFKADPNKNENTISKFNNTYWYYLTFASPRLKKQ